MHKSARNERVRQAASSLRWLYCSVHSFTVLGLMMVRSAFKFTARSCLWLCGMRKFMSTITVVYLLFELMTLLLLIALYSSSVVSVRLKNADAGIIPRINLSFASHTALYVLPFGETSQKYLSDFQTEATDKHACQLYIHWPTCKSD